MPALWRREKGLRSSAGQDESIIAEQQRGGDGNHQRKRTKDGGQRGKEGRRATLDIPCSVYLKRRNNRVVRKVRCK